MKKIVLLFCLFLCLTAGAAASDGKPVFYLFEVTGIIDAAISDHLVKGIDMAERDGAAAVIIAIDTPGGLMKSMRAIVDRILASKVPVITYVSPKGVRAASAGTFILLASHVAVMAEGTNIGAASPIDLQGNKADEKITNDSIVYIKNLARMKNRNQKWAEKAITENISSSEEDALKEKVIDFIAKDTDELMSKLDGFKVKVGDSEVKLEAAGAAVRPIAMSAKHRFLHGLTDPNIAYILFLVGVYGIIYELAHPGALFPGVAGAISIVLAFIGFDSIPINVAGLILIVLAVALFIAEVFTPTFGALAAAGGVSLGVGSFLLFPARSIDSAWGPSIGVIIFMTLLSVFILGFVLVLIFKAQRRKNIVGKESLIGHRGIAHTAVLAEGVVNVGGEEWNAWSDEQIEPKDIVEVVEAEGLRIKVKKVSKNKTEEKEETK
ncbi:MAG TPA: nodulation protein NfeD [bacterium]|nr:nodulation protein NfeD [bacterium]